MEAQNIDEGDERDRGLPAKCQTGSIWSIVGPAKRSTEGIGRWNTLKITCRGDLPRVVLNAITAAEADASRRPELIDQPRSGYINLKNIGRKGRGVEFRAVRVEGLD